MAGVTRIAPESSSVHSLRAVPLQGAEPVLDGRLDDPAWQRAARTSDFVQFEPDEGGAPTQPTEAWVLYGEDALWVAIRAHDSAPDSIVGQLTRRDEDSYSDELQVAVDSYFDRRTAFLFGVNPAGVRKDVYLFEDTQEDPSWDPVWEVATEVDDGGWNAEFRIPYGQLRFASSQEQTWGFNVLRKIGRYEETSTWAPLSQQESAMVSRFGRLEGLTDIDASSRLEIEPYSMARAERAPGDPADPFYESTDFLASVGADIEYGVTNNLTLNLTINPDFGQVEADPGEVNLTAFETYFPEKRPFFLEGRNVFDFGIGGGGFNEYLFYSRRIGRPPQGRVDAAGGYAEVPDNSTILGALKLSGKTESGWSIGVLNALTSQEDARIAIGTGDQLEDPVEPLTSYSAGRIQKDFREGWSALGAIGTVTARDVDVADDLLLHRSALSAGVDFRHRFGASGDYQIQGYALGSWVNGSKEAVAKTQRSPIHYFHRPDASHVDLDPTKTSLGGWAGTLRLAKIGGGSWRSSVFIETRSPGFEVNDIGFQTKTDYWVTGGSLGYQMTQPGEHFRRWDVNFSGQAVHTYGNELARLAPSLSGSVMLQNLWGANLRVQRMEPARSTSLLRGGPGVRTEGNWSVSGGVNTDTRRAVQGGVNWSWSVTPENDSRQVQLGTNIEWRPSSSSNVSLGPFIHWNTDDRQWLGRIEADGPHYLFGRLEQRTAGLTTRLAMSFTPDLSLQVYAQPFMSAGSYTDFKEIANPRAGTYEDRYHLLNVSPTGGRYEADLDGDGTPEAFDDPDFNSLQFRSNVVLRWEYRPGSTLFLVWSQERNGHGTPGAFAFGEDVGHLFAIQPTNVLMVKMSYWFSP